MLTNKRVKAALNLSLALLFAGISIGAALDGRLQAWPLALIFGAFSAYSLIKAGRLLRNNDNESNETR